MTVQVDWISACVTSPLLCQSGARLYETGRLMVFDRDGSMTYQKPAAFLVEGSHDTRIAVTSTDGSSLYLSGNPVKFFQGHNLFGSDDADALLLAAGLHVRQSAGLFPGPETWKANEYSKPRYTRIDLTRSYRFRSDEAARAWLRVASTGRSRHGGAVVKEGTVYWGKNSRRWSMKLYLKSDELKARGKMHRLARSLVDRAYRDLHEWAQGVVRFELTLRGMEIRDRNLEVYLRAGQARAIWQTYFDSITFNRNAEAIGEPDMLQAALSPHLAGYLARWKLGEDLRRSVSKPTFYRVRAELLKVAGVDIASAPERDQAGVPVELDPDGWDPEPLREHMFEPDASIKAQYGLL